MRGKRNCQSSEVKLPPRDSNCSWGFRGKKQGGIGGGVSISKIWEIYLHVYHDRQPKFKILTGVWRGIFGVLGGNVFFLQRMGIFLFKKSGEYHDLQRNL